ncbi:hypothetical protein HYDPIDRAFT_80385 [Hydnomerulius pinastri MD-312]|nr:hypothetical protein HYDPIDRAFT_80385 [Hydnomerulius pinastri MD-312]
MSLPKSTTVLIVGAGPTGLAAALSLLHHGVRDLVIVDAIEQGENISRAVAIHAATVEALDSIGASEELLERGIKAQDLYLRTRTSELVHANFTPLRKHTDHPYVLLLPQNITEEVLTKKLRDLGVTVRRPHKVVGMKQNDKDSPVTDVSFEDGQVISAKYVIGADGARSIVRTIAGIGFADPEGEAKEHKLTQMVLADVTFTNEPETQGAFNGIVSPDSFFLALDFSTRFNKDLAKPGEPITGSIYRIGCGVPVKNGPPPSSPGKEYLQDLLDQYGPTFMSSDPAVNPNPISVDQVVWSTRFRTHSAISDRAFTRLGSATPGGQEGGPVLLVGDAAHIHSPAGGQGMNLGIRDAIFLGEAVSKHISASSAPAAQTDDVDAILREYSDTRHARALEIIAFTKRLLRIVGLRYSPYSWWPFSLGFIRDVVLRRLGTLPFVQSRIVWGLSGLGRR